MEANWCKREDTKDKETTEIITKALNASMDIHPGCKAAPAWQSHLVQCHVGSGSCRHPCPVPLCVSCIWVSELCSFLTPLPGLEGSWKGAGGALPSLCWARPGLSDLEQPLCEGQGFPQISWL